MTDRITSTMLDRWRADPATFVETVLHDPDTGAPFELLDCERRFVAEMFRTDDDGHLIFTDLIYSGPKKLGKTTFGAILTITVVLLFGERFGEAVCVANDQEQAQGRVFTMCRRIIEVSPLLKGEAKITQDKIAFTATGGTIVAIASDAASAAGGHQSIACFDELWGFVQERARRLWDELVPVPTKKVSCRLVVTYAGFESESLLLKELYDRGMAQPEIGPDLRGGNGILMFWTHQPQASWQDARWLASMRRSLRPSQYLRMIENRWTVSESAFIDVALWDACVDPALTPKVTDRALPIWCGIDASVKHDSSALVAVTWSRQHQRVQLVAHRIYQPTPDAPIDFEAEIEATVLDWRARFNLREVYFDPFQMAASSQRLLREGIPMIEFPQTVPNLTASSQNLFELISGRNLLAYPNEAVRLAISRAVAIESPRGWRIGKDKQSHKVDIVVALAQAALAAVRSSGNYYDDQYLAFRDDADDSGDFDGSRQWRERRLTVGEEYKKFDQQYWQFAQPGGGIPWDVRRMFERRAQRERELLAKIAQETPR